MDQEIIFLARRVGLSMEADRLVLLALEIADLVDIGLEYDASFSMVEENWAKFSNNPIESASQFVVSLGRLEYEEQLLVIAAMASVWKMFKKNQAFIDHSTINELPYIAFAASLMMEYQKNIEQVELRSISSLLHGNDKSQRLALAFIYCNFETDWKFEPSLITLVSKMLAADLGFESGLIVAMILKITNFKIDVDEDYATNDRIVRTMSIMEAFHHTGKLSW